MRRVLAPLLLLCVVLVASYGREMARWVYYAAHGCPSCAPPFRDEPRFDPQLPDPYLRPRTALQKRGYERGLQMGASVPLDTIRIGEWYEPTTIYDCFPGSSCWYRPSRVLVEARTRVPYVWRRFPEDRDDFRDEAFGEWLGYNRALLPRLDSAFGDGVVTGAIRASRDLDSLWWSDPPSVRHPMETALFEAGGDVGPEEWTHRMTVNATVKVEDDGTAMVSDVRVRVACHVAEWVRLKQEERAGREPPDDRPAPELVDEVMPVLRRLRYAPLPAEWRGLGIVRTFEYFQLTGGTDFRKYRTNPCAGAAGP